MGSNINFPHTHIYIYIYMIEICGKLDKSNTYSQIHHNLSFQHTHTHTHTHTHAYIYIYIYIYKIIYGIIALTVRKKTACNSKIEIYNESLSWGKIYIYWEKKRKDQPCHTN